MCKLGALQKARLRRVHVSGDLIISGGLVLSEFHKRTFKFDKITFFLQTPPCKPTCLYNAPSLYTVDDLRVSSPKVVFEACCKRHRLIRVLGLRLCSEELLCETSEGVRLRREGLTSREVWGTSGKSGKPGASLLDCS